MYAFHRERGNYLFKFTDKVLQETRLGQDTVVAGIPELGEARNPARIEWAVERGSCSVRRFYDSSLHRGHELGEI
jgi:hypothetical protein